jgi:hypothetical protein
VPQHLPDLGQRRASPQHPGRGRVPQPVSARLRQPGTSAGVPHDHLDRVSGQPAARRVGGQEHPAAGPSGRRAGSRPRQAARLRVLVASDPELAPAARPDSERGGQRPSIIGIWQSGRGDLSERHDEIIRERLKRPA